MCVKRLREKDRKRGRWKKRKRGSEKKKKKMRAIGNQRGRGQKRKENRKNWKVLRKVFIHRVALELYEEEQEVL